MIGASNTQHVKLDTYSVSVGFADEIASIAGMSVQGDNSDQCKTFTFELCAYLFLLTSLF